MIRNIGHDTGHSHHTQWTGTLHTQCYVITADFCFQNCSTTINRNSDPLTINSPFATPAHLLTANLLPVARRLPVPDSSQVDSYGTCLCAAFCQPPCFQGSTALQHLLGARPFLWSNSIYVYHTEHISIIFASTERHTDHFTLCTLWTKISLPLSEPFSNSFELHTKGCHC